MGNNVSVSPEVTKVVINNIWARLDKNQKDTLATLAGVQKASISYSRSTGRISEAVAKAFEQVSQLPYWEILGASGPNLPPTDEDYSDLLRSLMVLQRHGAGDLGLLNGLNKIKNDIRDLAAKLTFNA